MKNHKTCHAALLASLLAFAATATAVDNILEVEMGALGEASITVEQRRNPVDARVQGDVMQALRGMDNIQGRIGVESSDSVVRLTGLVTTTHQAYRAGKVARNVEGVRAIDNQVRGMIGPSL